MIPADSDALSLLREIRDELRLLRADLAGHGRRPQTDAANLLRLIATFAGDRAFSARELVDHAKLPTSSDLLAAIVAAVGTVNPRKLGKCLRRLEGLDLDGLRLEVVGVDRSGLIWLLRVCEFETRKYALPIAQT